MFPTTCVDNFYDNPDEIREFALSLDYDWTGGNFPGERTILLQYINPYFYEQFCKRLTSIFYNFDSDDIEISVNTHFQKIYPYSQDPYDLLNSGWYHDDGGEQVAAGVIYLTPNANLNSGTTFARQIQPTPNMILSLRNNLYKNNNLESINVDDYRKELLQHNSCFEPTIEIKNVYNRMIFYNSAIPHKESNFFCSENEPRLTQVFFITKFKTKESPIDRMSKQEVRSSKLVKLDYNDNIEYF